MLREKLLGHYSVKIYRAEMFKLIKQGAPLFSFVCFYALCSCESPLHCETRSKAKKHFPRQINRPKRRISFFSF